MHIEFSAMSESNEWYLSCLKIAHTKMCTVLRLCKWSLPGFE